MGALFKVSNNPRVGVLIIQLILTDAKPEEERKHPLLVRPVGGSPAGEETWTGREICLRRMSVQSR